MNKKAGVDAPRLATVLARCYRAVSQIGERSVQEAGLCLTDFAALEAILHKGPLTITEIQSKVLLASGSMTAAVDRLEKKGLVARRPATDDRRDVCSRGTRDRFTAGRIPPGQASQLALRQGGPT